MHFEEYMSITLDFSGHLMHSYSINFAFRTILTSKLSTIQIFTSYNRKKLYFQMQFFLTPIYWFSMTFKLISKHEYF